MKTIFYIIIYNADGICGHKGIKSNLYDRLSKVCGAAETIKLYGW